MTDELDMSQLAGRPIRYADAMHPYERFRRRGDLVFIAGQLGVRDQQIVTGGIEAEMRQLLHNLDDVLNDAGCGRDDLLKVTVYLVDSLERLAMDPIYVAFFDDRLPVRTCITVAELPFGARVELDAIAAAPDPPLGDGSGPSTAPTHR